MKKIWFILIPIIIFTFVVFAYYWYRYSAMFRILQDDSLSEAEVASLVESKKGQDLNLLVAYFSYTGTTHGIVEEIRFKIGADLFCIEREEDYSDVYTESRLEIWHNDCPNLKTQLRIWINTMLYLLDFQYGFMPLQHLSIRFQKVMILLVKLSFRFAHLVEAIQKRLYLPF